MSFGYEVSKDMTYSKVKTAAKSDVTDLLIKLLGEEFGDESVGMIRTATSSGKNEIAVCIGTVEVNGEEKPIYVTLNPTVKDFTDRQMAKKSVKEFDFFAARQTYEDYIVEKGEKAVAAAKVKEDKKARDEAARKKKKEAQNSNQNDTEMTDFNDDTPFD